MGGQGEFLRGSLPQTLALKIFIFLINKKKQNVNYVSGPLVYYFYIAPNIIVSYSSSCFISFWEKGLHPGRTGVSVQRDTR